LSLALLAYVSRIESSICLTDLYHTRYISIFNVLSRKNRPCLTVMLGGGHYHNEERIFGQRWSDLYLNNFFVHGAHVIEKIMPTAQNVHKIIPFGLVTNFVYEKSNHRVASRHREYDLCLVSNFKPNYPNHESDLYFYKAISNFIKMKNYKLCIAGRCLDNTQECKDEFEYFSNAFKGVDLKYFPRNNFSTYVLCDLSIVSIGDYTTSLVESFYRGNKVVSYNSSGDKALNFPYEGFWNTLSEEHFCLTLSTIYEMQFNKWMEKTAPLSSKITSVE